MARKPADIITVSKRLAHDSKDLINIDSWSKQKILDVGIKNIQYLLLQDSFKMASDCLTWGIVILAFEYFSIVLVSNTIYPHVTGAEHLWIHLTLRESIIKSSSKVKDYWKYLVFVKQSELQMSGEVITVLHITHINPIVQENTVTLEFLNLNIYHQFYMDHGI